jgi:hypothetical protein
VFDAVRLNFGLCGEHNPFISVLQNYYLSTIGLELAQSVKITKVADLAPIANNQGRFFGIPVIHRLRDSTLAQSVIQAKMDSQYITAVYRNSSGTGFSSPVWSHAWAATNQRPSDFTSR